MDTSEDLPEGVIYEDVNTGSPEEEEEDYGEPSAEGEVAESNLLINEASGFVIPSEQTAGPAPAQGEGAEDSDGDGLTNDQELNAGTDPNNADTDGDGLSDYQELTSSRTDPKTFDTDKDGLTDGEEVQVYNTNPLIKDTDSDGYSDGDEVRAGYNPIGPGSL
jgi:hypothetical protein